MAPKTPSVDEVARFHRDGFLVLRGLLPTTEIQRLAQEAEELRARPDLVDPDNTRCRWARTIGNNGVDLDAFEPVLDLSPAVAQVARSQELLSCVEALCGESVHLFQDQFIFRPPGLQGCDSHQDYIAWSKFPKSLVTVLLAIDACDADNGAPEVVPGLHRNGRLTAEGQVFMPIPPSQLDSAPSLKLELSPGDAVFLGAFTPHRSGPNTSSGTRRVLSLGYNAASDGGDVRGDFHRRFDNWLRDRYAEHGKTNTFFR